MSQAAISQGVPGVPSARDSGTTSPLGLNSKQGALNSKLQTKNPTVCVCVFWPYGLPVGSN